MASPLISRFVLEDDLDTLNIISIKKRVAVSPLFDLHVTLWFKLKKFKVNGDCWTNGNSFIICE